MKDLEANKVNVLGVDLCEIEHGAAARLSIEAIHGNETGIVFFLSAVSSLFCQENEWASNLVNSLPMVLPGDQPIMQALPQAGGDREVSAERYIKEYFKAIFNRMNREYRSIFVVTASQDRLDSLNKCLQGSWRNIGFQGMVYEDESDGAGDKVANEINAHIPDVLLLLLPAPIQLSFLRDYGSMLNTRLCICVESLLELLADEKDYLPSWIRFLHLEGLYQWFKKERKLQSSIAGSIIKKRISEDSLDSDSAAGTGQDEQNK